MWSRGLTRLLLQALAVAGACMSAAVAQEQATAAASGVPPCASKLAPCGAYLKDTTGAKPPASCCDPLKEVATTEAACMCAVLADTAALQALGVAPEQGMGLALRCGVNTDASTCAKYTAAAGAGAATAGSTSTAASSASTGTAASTAAMPTTSGGTGHHMSLMAARSLIVGFSFIWLMIVA